MAIFLLNFNEYIKICCITNINLLKIKHIIGYLYIILKNKSLKGSETQLSLKHFFITFYFAYFKF